MAKKRTNQNQYGEMPPADADMSVEQMIKILRLQGGKMNDAELQAQIDKAEAAQAAREALTDNTFKEPLKPIQKENVSDYQRERIRMLLAERAKRKCEALKLYEPFPVAINFHHSKARERLVRGSNRSGKTTTCAVEFAWAVSGKHPILSGVEGGYPLEGGRAIVVGYDEGHLGQVVYPKLFKAGVFRIIRDLETKQWRAYRPWEESDKKRKKESKPAPPLIPQRMIKGKFAWRKRSLGIPEKVTLTNGWEIYFYSSKAKPVQGTAFDVVWFDEELERQSPSWYAEMVMRIDPDVKMRFIWSATPHVGGDDLINLHDNCEKDKHSEKPLSQEFLMTLLDNPHIDDEEKQNIKLKFRNKPDELRVRFSGEYAYHGLLVYPEFSITCHEMKRNTMRKLDNGNELPMFPGGQVPLDWTRYVAIDPGRQFLAAIFCAVPPLSVGKFLLFYDEVFILDADAKQFGEVMDDKTKHQAFEAFIIDRHGSQVHDAGSGLELEFQYSESLRNKKVWDRVRRRSFVVGESDRQEGIESVRDLLLLQDDGKPTLRVLENAMENFRQEIKNWRWNKVKGERKKKAEERNNHTLDCARYLALYKPTYRKPQSITSMKSAAVLRFEEKRNREKDNDESFVNFGPTVHSR